MFGIIGIIVIFVMVFGGFLAAGGHLDIILHSLPYEMAIIGGAAVGAFLISNELPAVIHTMKDVGKVFKGPKWKKQDFRDMLCLIFTLIRVARSNPIELEGHIESPETSALWGKYPRLLKDKDAVEIICDTLRSASMNYDDPHQVEEVLEKRIEIKLHHAMHSSHALQNMADGLPALGIVAAVLGVIKTMSSIDQPPEVLGKLIGGALVGTFLGVFLAYGLVGPFAAKVKTVIESDQQFYLSIRDVLIANLHKHPPNICVEVGRQAIPGKLRPSFSDLEDVLKELKKDVAA
jgi:chemotaxis protein MotA